MIQIEEKALALIKTEAFKTYPDECCGFMVGEEDQLGVKWAYEILPVDNAKEGDRRRRFEIAPLDYLKAERHATEKGLLLLGIYHSHPNHPPIPSETDLKSAQPYFSYIIASVTPGSEPIVRSWVLSEAGRFEEEEIRIYDSNIQLKSKSIWQQ